MSHTMYTEDQLSEVTSWMEDEGRSVTITTVSQSLGLSRSQAQALLEQIEERNSVVSSSFRVTVSSESSCMINSNNETSTTTTIPSTVFQLAPSTSSKEGYLYALMTRKESIKITHERDMDQMRELLVNNNIDNLTVNAIDVITPAEQIISMMQSNNESSDRPLVSTLDRSSSIRTVAPTKKATTAESFFQKKNVTGESNVTTKVKDTIKEQTKKTKNDTSTSKKFQETSKENEKENYGKASKVGSVDDFVGDEDDSDDDDDPMDVDVPPERKIIRGRKQPREEKKEEEVHAIEKEPAVPIRGAMDDFATEVKEKPQQDASSGRRRRKKLIQKTSMDAQGYLHTETQEVWEDIPTDEEEEPVLIPKRAPTLQQQASSKKTSMKQGNLMGFFTKKK